MKIKQGKYIKYNEFLSGCHNHFSFGVLDFAEELAEVLEKEIANNGEKAFTKEEIDVIVARIQLDFKMTKVMLEYSFNILREYWVYSKLVGKMYIIKDED